MRSYLFRVLLDNYIKHKDPANLRIHVLLNFLGWLCLFTGLSQVHVPVPIPVLGANLGAVLVLGVAAAWLLIDALIPLLVLLTVCAWAACPGSPWGHPHGLLGGLAVPFVVTIALLMPALLGHIYYHEHAAFASPDRRSVPTIILSTPLLFWLIRLLRAGYRPALKARLDAAERALLLPRQGGVMTNWAGTFQCRPQLVAAPQTLDDLAAAVKLCARQGRRLQVMGSGFSWSSFCATDDMLIFCERLDGVVVDLSDPARPAVWAECGATNRQVNAALARHGLQLPWNVVLETVRIAGTTSMGTHGSGAQTGTLGDLVEAFEVIDGSGALRVLSQGSIGAEGMSAARVGLGLFGVIARVRLRVEPADRVLQIDELMPVAEALDRVQELVRERDSVELYWVPFTDKMWVHSFTRTALPLTRAQHGFWFLLQNLLQMLIFSGLHALTARWAPRLMPLLLRLLFLGLSMKRRVLYRTEAVHHRRWIELRRCSCIEIGFKTDHWFRNVRAAFLASQRIVAQHAAAGRFPINMMCNVRFTGPSAGLLSAAYGPGTTCWIEALSWGRPAGWEEASAELCAEWLKDPSALPHWAKEFEHVPGIWAILHARLSDRLSRFRSALRRTGVDPHGMFVNRLTSRILLQGETPVASAGDRHPAGTDHGGAYCR